MPRKNKRKASHSPSTSTASTLSSPEMINSPEIMTTPTKSEPESEFIVYSPLSLLEEFKMMGEPIFSDEGDGDSDTTQIVQNGQEGFTTWVNPKDTFQLPYTDEEVGSSTRFNLPRATMNWVHASIEDWTEFNEEHEEVVMQVQNSELGKCFSKMRPRRAFSETVVYPEDDPRVTGEYRAKADEVPLMRPLTPENYDGPMDRFEEMYNSTFSNNRFKSFTRAAKLARNSRFLLDALNDLKMTVKKIEEAAVQLNEAADNQKDLKAEQLKNLSVSRYMMDISLPCVKNLLSIQDMLLQQVVTPREKEINSDCLMNSTPSAKEEPIPYAEVMAEEKRKAKLAKQNSKVTFETPPVSEPQILNQSECHQDEVFEVSEFCEVEVTEVPFTTEYDDDDLLEKEHELNQKVVISELKCKLGPKRVEMEERERLAVKKDYTRVDLLQQTTPNVQNTTFQDDPPKSKSKSRKKRKYRISAPPPPPVQTFDQVTVEEDHEEFYGDEFEETTIGFNENAPIENKYFMDLLKSKLGSQITFCVVQPDEVPD